MTDFVTWLKIEKEPIINIMDSFSKYHSKLYLSQVILFFERHNIKFTKTMIQNYVRIGLLNPLSEKRYYVKEHIIMLFFIASLKSILSLDELKILFENIDDLENLYMLFIRLSNSEQIENDINTLDISENLKKTLFLIIYYRTASISKNLINRL
ncbi:MAG: DUF1836 domain-containing protein [Defluviitaleaceae bacterium]|nr:DUF1836 domain-containing protein [Defluviitaleaceae bacterium]